MTSAARLEQVSAGYGPFRALFDIDLEISVGQTVALLGPNGAGKSTVARVLSGLVPATAGRVKIAGSDATSWSAVRLRRASVVHVPEGRGVFSSLTVEQNLRLALSTEPRRRRREPIAEACERFEILGQRKGQRAGTLSGGQQRLLSLAAALVDPPTLLIADEISLGLAPNVLDEVYRALGELSAAGSALLLIEQQTERALMAATNAVVLSHGRVVLTGSPAQVASSLDVSLPDGSSPPHL